MSISINELLYVAADRKHTSANAAGRTRRPGTTISFSEVLNSLQNAPDYKTQAATPDVQVYPGTLSWLSARQESIKSRRLVSAAYGSDDE
ncbi:hypothetical protein FACS1894202_03200 [Clostridia bacterium]|nr:hypothetical protein FACS1894202_03200 [Clostridia bacterium]GHU94002.1 hypothetical protein FACS1894208_04360 [Clostridia bacterium]